MEKGPEIRIVGGASQEEKEISRQKTRSLLFNHPDSFRKINERQAEELSRVELPKTNEQTVLIGFANRATNELMQKFSLESYDVPVENFHIVPADFFEANVDTKSDAATRQEVQAAFFKSDICNDDNVLFGTYAVHEMLHLKNHVSQEVEKENNRLIRTFYRTGVASYSSQKSNREGRSHIHFEGLTEAIVTNEEKELFKKLLEEPELKEYKKWIESDQAKQLIGGAVKSVKRVRVFPEDVSYLNVSGEKGIIKFFGYVAQRRTLEYVCEEIQKQFPEQYEDSRQVIEEFLKTHFTGRLLPITRLVEQTFGDGSFRRLGDMGTEEESGVLCLESLKKARAKQIRKNKK